MTVDYIIEYDDIKDSIKFDTRRVLCRMLSGYGFKFDDGIDKYDLHFITIDEVEDFKKKVDEFYEYCKNAEKNCPYM